MRVILYQTTHRFMLRYSLRSWRFITRGLRTYYQRVLVGGCDAATKVHSFIAFFRPCQFRYLVTSETHASTGPHASTGLLPTPLLLPGICESLHMGLHHNVPSPPPQRPASLVLHPRYAALNRWNRYIGQLHSGRSTRLVVSATASCELTVWHRGRRCDPVTTTSIDRYRPPCS